ncbi:DUF4157 domain-containing protein [Isoptericola jiangsuensis]|uniref:eCIS core domain-containing protein n=1 Tax=Isoptericola jiangsuensis TaxID=548579 RepID=UPI003AAE5D2A
MTGPVHAKHGVHTAGDGQAAPSGSRMPTATAALLGARFGHDFSAVRVHTDERAGATARALGARAVTIGQDIHFAPGRYDPHSAAGRHLLAHELAHVVQQDGRAPTGTTPDRSGEHAAHAAADRVAAGGSVRVGVRGATGPQLDDGTTPAAPTADDDPVDVITGGLKTVGTELVKNPEVKEKVLDPLAEVVGARAVRAWGSLGGGGKVATVAFGASTVGVAGGALLSDPSTRKLFEGVNLAAPLGIVPFATLSTFTIAPLDTAPGTVGPYKVTTGFDLGDVLGHATERIGWKGLTFTADLTWNYDPRTENLTLTGATGTLGVLPGLTVDGGTYPDLLRPPAVFPSGSGLVESRQSLPQGPQQAGVPDVRFMVTFDLLKFAESGLVPGLGRLLGRPPGKGERP